MSFARFMIWSSVTGVIVPFIFGVTWWLVNSHSGISVGVKIALEKVTLVLWPSSIVMLAETSDRWFSLKLFLLASLVNVVLYTGLGACIWYGLTKYRVILLLPIIVVSIIWWKLLTLR